MGKKCVLTSISYYNVFQRSAYLPMLLLLCITYLDMSIFSKCDSTSTRYLLRLYLIFFMYIFYYLHESAFQTSSIHEHLRYPIISVLSFFTHLSKVISFVSAVSPLRMHEHDLSEHAQLLAISSTHHTMSVPTCYPISVDIR